MFREILFTLCGYFFVRLTSGKKSGDKNRFDVFLKKKLGLNTCTSLKFKTKKFNVHVHHWIPAILIFIFVKKAPIKYFAYGVYLQGYNSYEDRFKIISRVE